MKRRSFAAGFLVLAGLSGAAPASVEINTASQAELERLKGIGVELSERLLLARAQSPFKDWRDLMARVRGIGPKLALKLSEQGLTIEGRSYPRD